MRILAILLFLWASNAAMLVAQVTVIQDGFETGTFSSDWDSTTSNGAAIVFDAGAAAGGSDYYARVEGVSNSSGGLGVSLNELLPGSPGASDFSLEFDLRIDQTGGGVRQFSLISGSNPLPGSGAVMNIRYQDGIWSAYNGAWQDIVGLGSMTPGTWNRVTVTGSQWGTGISGNARFGISLTDHLGMTTSANSLAHWQGGDPDQNGAKSMSWTDIWGDNPGYDLDNVVVTATPQTPVPSTTTITPVNPVSYSGIYPHMAVSNNSNESGIGGLINRQGRLYYMTYPPHSTTGSSQDKFYHVDVKDLSHTKYNLYPGGTHANRYRDSTLGIDVIGAAYIDAQENVRFLPIGNASGQLRGRITGTSPHLSDPNKLYYFTMEEGLYEVDFSNLTNPIVTELRRDRNFGSTEFDLPGVHAKGLYTAQGRVFVTNNGRGGGGEGVLAEWDGVSDPKQAGGWNIVDSSAQYTEVTSRFGPENVDPQTTAAVWAIGWDDSSVILNVRDAATGWTKFRLPKGSYTHGHPNGWYTEWPRIRDIGLSEGHLMSHHGQMFTIPEDFDASNTGGIRPVAAHHKMIVDYVEHGSQIVFAGNDATRFSNNLVPKANSNLMFLEKSGLSNYGGTPRGYGGVWDDQNTAAGDVSDAFFVGGFQNRVVHFAHDSVNAANFEIQLDAGDGNWTTIDTVSVAGNSGTGYGYYVLPKSVPAEWLRVRSIDDAIGVTSYMHLDSRDRLADPKRLRTLARPGDGTARSQGLLRSNNTSQFELEFAADILDPSGAIVDTGYYRARLNETTAQLELVAISDPTAEQALRSNAATTQDFGVDAASVFIEEGGVRYRLPKGDSAFDTATPSGWRRGVREVVTERAVMNIHGTFYEVPRNFEDGGIERILPITTHNLDLFDYASWRGMLVLSGNDLDAVADDHYVPSDDGRVGLWFGNVDDLYHFGAPEGVGGPWMDTSVVAGVSSDPYLMAGYDRKVLELSHQDGAPVDFTIEIDFLGTGEWEVYSVLSVDAGETHVHVFEDGFSSHWIRLTSNATTTATAWFEYTSLDGDFDGNASYDCDDIDTLTAAIADGLHDRRFDLNQDGWVDEADLSAWLAEAGYVNLDSQQPLLPGDANLDGSVDGADFIVWNDNKFTAANAWCSGDFNADGFVDGRDFLLWNDHKFTSSDAAQASAVPEPVSPVLLVSVLVMMWAETKPCEELPDGAQAKDDS